jgi:hypothetical protein
MCIYCIYIHIYIYVYAHIYIYMYMCVCVCMYVYLRMQKLLRRVSLSLAIQTLCRETLNRNTIVDISCTDMEI